MFLFFLSIKGFALIHDLLQTVQDTVPEDGGVGYGVPLNGNSLPINDALHLELEFCS